eukprot:474069-Prorocentrum_minimum.AAC.1
MVSRMSFQSEHVCVSAQTQSQSQSQMVDVFPDVSPSTSAPHTAQRTVQDAPPGPDPARRRRSAGG